MKLTLPVARVVCAVGRLLDERPGEVYGLVICDLSGLASGTVYQILRRMEDNGFVSMELKDVYYSGIGRRPQRHYAFTPTGRDFLKKARQRLLELQAL
jgi:PadR family transcriptional regulator PadR